MPRFQDQTREEKELSYAWYFLKMTKEPFQPPKPEGSPANNVNLQGHIKAARPDQHLLEQERQKEIEARHYKRLEQANKLNK